MRRMLVAMLLVAAACGNSEPPAPKPVSKTRTEAPPPPAPVDRDLEQSELAIAALEAAKTPQEAHDARALYTGTERAGTVDRIFKKRLSDLDFAEMSAAIAAIRACETPEDAVKAAELYTGEVHKAAVERTMNEHIDNLIKEDPTLRRPNTGRPNQLDALKSLLKECSTESEAAAVIAKYKGSANESEIDVALELWRWEKPVLIDWASVPFEFNSSAPFRRLSDGRIVVTHRNGAVVSVQRDGEILQEFKATTRGPNLIVGISPDEQYLFTTNLGSQDAIQKWNLASGELLLQFASAQKPRGFKHQLTRILPDASGVITWDTFDYLDLWDTTTGTHVRQLGRLGSLTEAWFNGDGSTGYFAGGRLTTAIDISTGTEITKYKDLIAGDKRQADISADGKTWASMKGEDGVTFVVVYDAESGSQRGKIKVPSFVYSMFWLKSGRHLLVFTSKECYLVDAEEMVICSSHSIPTHGFGSIMDPQRITLTRTTGTSYTSENPNPPTFFTYGREP